MEKLAVSSSPHIKAPMTTSKIMTQVLIALIPAGIAATVIFGGRALILIGFCVAFSVIWEKLFSVVTKRKDTTDDISAVVTGLLLAYNLPVTIPLWMAGIGTFVAIIIVKQLFGGIGQNFANPAITGRIVLMLSFPSAMTTWAEPFYYSAKDVVTGATPLVTGDATYKELFLGTIGGSLGETCSLALIIGGIYLMARNIIKPYAPAAFLGTIMVFSFIAGKDPIYQLLSGGIILAAFFMITDYVTAPVTDIGKVIFGIGCGVITCVIRFYGGKAEGASYAILLMNILVPYIDMVTSSTPFGAKKAEKIKEGEK